MSGCSRHALYLVALALVGTWCLFRAASFTTSIYESRLRQGRDADWFDLFGPYGVSCTSWIIVTPLMLLVCHFLRLERGRKTVVILLHLLAGLLFGSLTSIYTHYAYRWAGLWELPVWEVSAALFGCVWYVVFFAGFSSLVYYISGSRTRRRAYRRCMERPGAWSSCHRKRGDAPCGSPFRFTPNREASSPDAWRGDPDDHR